MMKNLVAILLLFAMSLSLNAQRKIGDYTYIVVPEQFSFQKGKDKYRLNTLARYELKNYGYSALFLQELPEDVKRCDALWLEGEGKVGFPWTKVKLYVKDCNGFTLFETKEGRSKEKDYALSYQEAMREALSSFMMMEDEDIPSSEEIEAATSNRKKASAAAVTAAVVADAPQEVQPSKEVSYSYQDYRLVEEVNGYSIWQGDKQLGELIPTSQKNMYLVSAGSFNGIARKSKNTISIERQVEGTDELMVMEFVRNE